MIKSINLNNSLSRRVNTICFLADLNISQSELSVLCAIIEYSDNMQFTVSTNSRNEVSELCGITDSNLSTLLHRLEKKDLIARQGKTILISPLFKDIDQLTGILVKFE